MIPWNKGKKLSEEYRKKLSKAHKGKKMHPNTRKALALSLRGNTHTLGKKMPQSMVEKSRLRMIGNKINLGRVPSTITRNKMSEAHKGDRAQAWKGGITPINQKIRGSREYGLWDSAVKTRDGNRCKKCKLRGKSKLAAHHILNFASYPSLRFVLENGVTLCRLKCHKEFHQIYGRKNNTHEQLKEFLYKK